MLLAALALLPVAGLGLYNALSRRAEAAGMAKNNALQWALFCANNEQRMAASANQLLSLMAQLPGVKKMDAQVCGPLFTRAQQNEPSYENVGLLDANGKVVACAKPVGLRGPLVNENFFRKAVGQGTFGESDFEMETNGKQAETICGEPVRRDDGTIEGVVFLELDLQWMTNLSTKFG